MAASRRDVELEEELTRKLTVCREVRLSLPGTCQCHDGQMGEEDVEEWRGRSGTCASDRGRDKTQVMVDLILAYYLLRLHSLNFCLSYLRSVLFLPLCSVHPSS